MADEDKDGGGCGEKVTQCCCDVSKATIVHISFLKKVRVVEVADACGRWGLIQSGLKWIVPAVSSDPELNFDSFKTSLSHALKLRCKFGVMVGRYDGIAPMVTSLSIVKDP